jgi:hypothetical protein
MRIQTAFLINIQLEENDRITDPKKLMRFQWEKEEAKELNEPDWEALEREIKGI